MGRAFPQGASGSSFAGDWVGGRMYRACIIEDDRDQAEALAAMVRSSSAAGRIASVDIAEPDARDDAAHAGYDILLVDINFGPDVETDGIEFVRELPHGSGSSGTAVPQVIYVSGYLEYAPMVYGTDHVWFLAKPVEPARLDEALGCAISRLDTARTRALALTAAGGRTVRVDPANVTYAESRRHKTQVHVLGAGDALEAGGSLDRLAALLPSTFVRCHKSYLVNMDHIGEFSRDELTLSDGERVPVSQRRRKEALERFVAHVGRTL